MEQGVLKHVHLLRFLSVLLELDLYQVACSKGNQITSQIVFKIIGRPMHFLVGLVFLSLSYWNRQTSFSSGCRVIVAQLSLGPLRGEAPPSLQREKRGKEWGKQKVSDRNIVSDALGWGFTSCPPVTATPSLSSVMDVQTNKHTHLRMSQTLKLWDKEARNVHYIHHWGWFFACFLLESDFLNYCCPEQCHKITSAAHPLLCPLAWNRNSFCWTGAGHTGCSHRKLFGKQEVSKIKS